MSKKLKFISIIIAIGLCLYFGTHFYLNNQSYKEKNIKTPKLLTNIPNSLVPLKSIKKNIIKTYETNDPYFEELEKIDLNWLSTAEKVLGGMFLQYKDLRLKCETEKEVAYQRYHDYLRQQYGNNFKYNISEDQSIVEKNINQKYDQKLLQIIGEEKFKEFLKNRDEFNEKIRRNSNGQNSLVIEF